MVPSRPSPKISSLLESSTQKISPMLLRSPIEMSPKCLSHHTGFPVSSSLVLPPPGSAVRHCVKTACHRTRTSHCQGCYRWIWHSSNLNCPQVCNEGRESHTPASATQA